MSRNRYAYVNNSPVRYTDPTGNCKNDEDKVDREDCARHLAELRHYGFNVVDPWNWEVTDLAFLVQSIYDMMHAHGNNWSIADFKRIMGIGDGEMITIESGNLNGGNPGCADSAKNAGTCTYGATDPDGKRITFDLDAIRKTPNAALDAPQGLPFLKWVFVHELGHVWDIASGGSLRDGGWNRSNAMWASIGGRLTNETGIPSRSAYDYASGGSGSSQFYKSEVWADSVAAYVYGVRGSNYHEGQTLYDYVDTQFRRNHPNYGPQPV